MVPVDAPGHLLRDSHRPSGPTRAPRTQTADFFDRVDRDRWYMTTGNGFPAECYAVFKIMWYRDNEPEMFSPGALAARLQGLHQPAADRARRHRLLLRLGLRASTTCCRWAYARSSSTASRLPRALFPEIVPSTAIIGDAHRRRRPGCWGLPRACRWPAAAWTTPAWHWAREEPADGRVYTSLGSSSWIAVSSPQAGARSERKAVRVHARRPGAVHLGGEHLLRRQLLPLGRATCFSAAAPRRTGATPTT